jgi:SAM-dependent methyltransferase
MQPNHQIILQEYEKEDMYERRYDAYAHAKYEILLNWLKESSDIPQKILNVGCGSGELCILLAQLGHIVTGIDPAEEYITIARSQLEQRNLSNCTFFTSDLEDVYSDLFQHNYDIVFSTDVVEHIANDIQAFEQLAALVKPGGDLFITVPGGQYLFGFHDEQLGHYRRYSLQQLDKVLPSNLKRLKMRYFGISLIPVAWLYSRILRRYYPVSQTGNSDTNPILTRFVRIILTLEKQWHPPLGTSCLVWARKTN